MMRHDVSQQIACRPGAIDRYVRPLQNLQILGQLAYYDDLQLVYLPSLVNKPVCRRVTALSCAQFQNFLSLL